MVPQRGGVGAVFGAEVGDDEIDAGRAVVPFGEVGRGEDDAGRGGGFADFVRGAFNDDAVAPVLPERGGLLDVRLDGQRRGVVHDRGELPEIPREQLGVGVVLDVVEVDQDGDVAVGRVGAGEFAEVGQEEAETDFPVATVCVVDGLRAVPVGVGDADDDGDVAELVGGGEDGFGGREVFRVEGRQDPAFRGGGGVGVEDAGAFEDEWHGQRAMMLMPVCSPNATSSS